MTWTLSPCTRYVLACVPETLPSAMLSKSKHSKLKAPHVQLMGQAIEQIQFLASSRFLQVWLLAVLLKSLASGLSSINASFTLAVYGWKPGEWQAWIWPSEIISMSSLGILGPWAGRKKAEAVISATALVSVAAHVLQMLAPFHALALLGPHFIAGILAFVRPVSAAYLSGRFPASQQAKVQAIAHLSHNCGISLSMAIFSSPQLFRPQARGWDAARPFLWATQSRDIRSFIRTACCSSRFFSSQYCPMFSSLKPAGEVMHETHETHHCAWYVFLSNRRKKLLACQCAAFLRWRCSCMRVRPSLFGFSSIVYWAAMPTRHRSCRRRIAQVSRPLGSMQGFQVQQLTGQNRL